MKKVHIVEPATAEQILTSLKIPKKMWPKNVKKKKKKAEFGKSQSGRGLKVI